MRIQVGIVEDHASVRVNLGQLIDAASGFKCVALCESAEEALRKLPQANPDVVLMDMHLPGQSPWAKRRFRFCERRRNPT